MQKSISSNLEESIKFARDFAEKILTEIPERRGAFVLALCGDLGSGKND